VILAAVLLIAAVGAMADRRPVAAAPRLVLQTFAVAAVLATLPPELRLLPILPWWGERIFLCQRVVVRQPRQLHGWDPGDVEKPASGRSLRSDQVFCAANERSYK
jgi:hypothetical protein